MSIVHNKRLQDHMLEVSGDFACFTRPEMKVERYSYPCPTPSAARGIFEAIYFKPEFHWQVVRIELLNKPSLIALRRNEVKDKFDPKTVAKWMAGTAPVEPIWADGDKGFLGTDQKGRTQRQTMALREPRFRLTARIVPRPGKENQQKAYDEQFIRRASQGKCFYQPCFGCREFVAFFRYVEILENEPPPVDYSHKIGWMLYDVFDLDKNNHALFQDDWKKVAPSIALFQADIRNGILDVPPYDSDLVKKPDIGQRRAV